MKIICTTVVRAAKQGDIHGSLYVVDTDEGKLLHHAPYEMDFINDNERGGERGLRGICVLPDRIIVSDSAGFIELDKETYEIRRTYQNSDYFKSIHEIVYHDGYIWATSTAYDAIVKVDLDFNVVGFWEILGENKDDYKILTGKKEITSDTKSENDNFHINSIFVTDEGRLVFSGLITPLYDFETMEEVHPIPEIRAYSGHRAKSFVHNFYKYKNFTVANLTSFSSLGISYTGRPEGVDNRCDFFSYNVPRCKKSKFQVDEIASDNWNRGFARKGDKLFIGSSPARILVFDVAKQAFEKEISLETDIRHAIHGLEILD